MFFEGRLTVLNKWTGSTRDRRASRPIPQNINIYLNITVTLRGADSSEFYMPPMSLYYPQELSFYTNWIIYPCSRTPGLNHPLVVAKYFSLVLKPTRECNNLIMPCLLVTLCLPHLKS